jgi:hypothetical protein
LLPKFEAAGLIVAKFIESNKCILKKNLDYVLCIYSVLKSTLEINYCQSLEVVTVGKQKGTSFAESALNYYKPSLLQGIYVSHLIKK